MKRAFLVFGAESSGNRLMTRILVACSCYGDGEHHQRLNFDPCPTDANIVWFRSVPYAQTWPDLIGMVNGVRASGYDVTALVMMRDWYAVAQSQVKTGHVRDLDAAYRNVAHGYKVIFEMLIHTRIKYIIVSYESMIMRQHEYLGWLLDRLGLTLQGHIEPVTDQNEKHYANT